MSENNISCPHCGYKIERKGDIRKKNEIIHDYIECNCAMCGRPIKIEESYICKNCSKKNICKNCVEEIMSEEGFNIWVCHKCLNDMGRSCSLFGCNKVFSFECIVCKKHWCNEHVQEFINILPQKGIKSEKRSFYCKSCEGYVCRSCFTIKKQVLREKTYHCNKCGFRLEKRHPE